jgi:hypothetical protein
MLSKLLEFGNIISGGKPLSREVKNLGELGSLTV